MRSCAKMVSVLALATSAALLGAACADRTESGEQTQGAMSEEPAAPRESEEVARADEPRTETTEGTGEASQAYRRYAGTCTCSSFLGAGCEVQNDRCSSGFHPECHCSFFGGNSCACKHN